MARLALLLTAIAAGCSGCHARSMALPSLTAVRVMLADVERQRQENRAGEADSPGATGPPKAEPTRVADYASRPPGWSISDCRLTIGWSSRDRNRQSTIGNRQLIRSMVDYRAGRYEPGFLQEPLDSPDEPRMRNAPSWPGPHWWASHQWHPLPASHEWHQLSAATRKMGGEEPGPLPGFRQTLSRDARRLPSELWSDIKSVYASPENLLLLGGTYGAALALQSTGPDDTVADRLGEHRIFKDDWRDAFGAAGNPLVHFGLAGLWYVVGQQTQDDHTYEVAGTLRRALMVNGLSVLVGQVASGGHGPNGEFGALPSGHTSSTFAVASVMHRSYGPWVGVPLYALGGLVAMERLDSDEHFLSDVVMGAVMGLVIGHTIAGERELELVGGRIVPYVDPQTQSSGLAWVVHFK